MLRAIGILLLALMVWLPAQAAPDEKRVALIIGNDAYKGLKKLDNGANDARAMERELRAMGFETMVKVNAGRREMHAAINEFGGKLASGSVGLFYYAGHGIQSGDKNFLVPVDAELQSEDDLVSDAIDLGRVMQAMEAARNRLNIVVLDACRDNPLPKGGRSGTRGLAVVQAPTGTLVAYATGPGKVAQDGDRGGNGVYTGELVKALREPGLTIEQVFKRAGAQVIEKTGGKQVPWMQASVSGDFYLRPGTSAAVAAPSGGGVDRDALFWQSIKDSLNPGDFEDYLAMFPGGTFARLAQRKVDQLKSAKTAALVASRPEPALEGLDREMAVSRDAKLREYPDARSKQLTSLPAGTMVQVTGRVKGDNWYAVSRKGTAGYVVMDTLEEPAAYRERQAKAEAAARQQQEAALRQAEAERERAGRVAAEEENRRRQQLAAVVSASRDLPFVIASPIAAVVRTGAILYDAPGSFRSIAELPAAARVTVLARQASVCLVDGGSAGKGWVGCHQVGQDRP